jgi:hypothetical protein
VSAALRPSKDHNDVGEFRSATSVPPRPAILVATITSVTGIQPELWIDRAASAVSFYVEDPDAMFAQAVRAGATPAAEMADEHGWRLGRIFDPWNTVNHDQDGRCSRGRGGCAGVWQDSGNEPSAGDGSLPLSCHRHVRARAG